MFQIPNRFWTGASLGLAAAIALSGCDNSQAPSRSTTADAAPRPKCNSTWSREVYDKSRSTPMVRDVAVRTDGLHIVVRRQAWSILKLEERDRLVSAFDCAIAGPNYLKAVIVEDSLGRPLKAYGALDLYEARKLQP